MLSDSKFIENSLISNLYYLRTLREFCAGVQLSLPSNYKDYIDKIEKLAKQCEKLGIKIINYANKNIPSSALNSNIIVTPYTLRLEELTNKLFNYDINTNITKQELTLEPGITKPTPELIKVLEDINQEALIIAKEFINFSSELNNSIKNQNVFCFYYNSLNTNTIYEMNIYITILERLINKDNLDPLYVIDYNYNFNKLISDIATYIRGECDPIYVDIVNQANNFVNEYNNLVLEYENIILSPENQKNMNDNSLELNKRFKLFVESCLEKLLKKELYFSSPPITKDNALTAINFFIYNLEENIKEL